VTKCQGPRAAGGPMGLPASELEPLNIDTYANYDYLKYLFIMFSLFNVNL
jgi:hypothetical protein